MAFILGYILFNVVTEEYIHVNRYTNMIIRGKSFENISHLKIMEDIQADLEFINEPHVVIQKVNIDIKTIHHLARKNDPARTS